MESIKSDENMPGLYFQFNNIAFSAY